MCFTLKLTWDHLWTMSSLIVKFRKIRMDGCKRVVLKIAQTDSPIDRKSSTRNQLCFPVFHTYETGEKKFTRKSESNSLQH